MSADSKDGPPLLERIVVIEDEPVVRMHLEGFLAELGYTSAGFDNAIQALSYHEPDNTHCPCGNMARARLKFFELHSTYKSMLAEQALRYIQLLYEIESEIRDLKPDLRCQIR